MNFHQKATKKLPVQEDTEYKNNLNAADFKFSPWPGNGVHEQHEAMVD